MVPVMTGFRWLNGYRTQSGLGYPQGQRAAGVRWWRLLLAVPVGMAAYIALITLVVMLWPESMQNDILLRPQTISGEQFLNELTGLHLSLIILIPVVWLMLLIMGQSWSQLLSLTGRFRWQLFGRAYLLTMLLALLASLFSLADPSWRLQWNPYWLGFALIILLLTPLQAMAEELVFRGIVNQSIGRWFRQPLTSFLIAMVLSSVLFAWIHGDQQSPLLWFDRFWLGCLLAWLVWRTGGLEMAIAIHIANNQWAFALDVAGGQWRDMLQESAITTTEIVLHLLMMTGVVIALDRYYQRQQWQITRDTAG